MITYCQRDYVNFFFLFSACSLCIGFALVRFLKKKKREKKKEKGKKKGKKKEKKNKGSVLLLSYSVRLYKSLVMCIFFFTGGTCL